MDKNQLIISKDELGTILYCIEAYFGTHIRMLEYQKDTPRIPFHRKLCPACRLGHILTMNKAIMTSQDAVTSRAKHLAFLNKKHINAYEDLIKKKFRLNEKPSMRLLKSSIKALEHYLMQYTLENGRSKYNHLIPERYNCHPPRASTFPSTILELLFKLRNFSQQIDGQRKCIQIDDEITLRNLNTKELEAITITASIKTFRGMSNLHPTEKKAEMLLGKREGACVEIELPSLTVRYKILDIQKPESLEDFRILFNDKGCLDKWPEFNSSGKQNSGISSKYQRKDETPLRKTGYSIWDSSNKERSRSERWHILTKYSIPRLGIDEVVSTISSHIYSRAHNENAVREWTYDLDRLETYYHRDDRIRYFDE